LQRFSLVDEGLPGAANGTAAWGDFDNDNDLDLLLTGAGVSSTDTLLFRNQGGSFIQVTAGLPNIYESAAAWGDYDLDGDLDLALSGLFGTVEDTRIYRNDGNGIFTAISDSMLVNCISSAGTSMILISSCLICVSVMFFIMIAIVAAAGKMALGG
jgi:hypothetical protein